MANEYDVSFIMKLKADGLAAAAQMAAAIKASEEAMKGLNMRGLESQNSMSTAEKATDRMATALENAGVRLRSLSSDMDVSRNEVASLGQAIRRDGASVLDNLGDRAEMAAARVAGFGNMVTNTADRFAPARTSSDDLGTSYGNLERTVQSVGNSFDRLGTFVRGILPDFLNQKKAVEDNRQGLLDLDFSMGQLNLNLGEHGLRTRQAGENHRFLHDIIRIGTDVVRLASAAWQGFTGLLSSAWSVFQTTAKEVEKVGAAAGEVATKVGGAAGGGGGGGAGAAIYAFVQGMIPGQKTAGNLTIAVAALAAAFIPFTIELGASLVLLGAWIAGATAFAAVIALAAGPIIAMTALIVGLGISATGGTKALDALAPAVKAQASAQEAYDRAASTVAVTQATINTSTHQANAAAMTKHTQALTTATEQNEAAQEALAKAQLAYDTKPTAMNLLNLNQAREQATESAKKQTAAEQAGIPVTQQSAASALRLKQEQDNLKDASEKLTIANQNLTIAQINANGPFATLDQHFENLTKTLGQAAIPMMATWINWIDTLLPKVQELALQMFSWYGERLPKVLEIAKQAFGNVLTGIERLATAWGAFFDRTIAKSPAFGEILNGAFNRVIDGMIGLMLNLESLANWFVARLPTLGSNANSVFGNIGTVVQWLGNIFGRFVDWIISNWPAINAMFQESWNAFKTGFAAIPITKFGDDLKNLGPVFEYISIHAHNLEGIYYALGFAVSALIGILEAVYIILLLVSAVILALAEGAHQAGIAVGGAADFIGKAWGGAGTAVGRAIDGILGHQSAVTPSAADAAKTVGEKTGSMSRDWEKAAGPGPGSIDDSATKIAGSVKGIRGESDTTAKKTTDDTTTMSGDYGTLASNSESSATRVQQAHKQVSKSTYGLGADTDNAFAAINRTIDNWKTNVATAGQGVVDAHNYTYQHVALALGGMTGAIGAFNKEHLNWWQTTDKNNKLVTGSNIDTGNSMITVYQGMGRKIVEYLHQHEASSTEQLKVNGQTISGFGFLGQEIGKVFDFIGTKAREWQTGIHTVGDEVNNWLHTVLGPAFSSFGTGVQHELSMAGGQFDAFGNAVRSMVADIVNVLNIFIRAVKAIPGINIPEVNYNAQNTRVSYAGPAGLRPLAEGGIVPVGNGFKTSGPVAVVGEGGGPEYVIPTEPKYRGNATKLWEAAGQELGFLEAGGIIGRMLASGVRGLLSGGDISAWLPNAGAMVQGPGGSFSHKGLNAWDFMVPMGSNLYAGAAGTVQPFSQGNAGYGNAIQFLMDQGGVVILGHLMRALTAGHVAAGTLIGLTDNTGFSTGPHLHFEVRGSPLTPGGGGLGALVHAFVDPLVDAARNVGRAALGRTPDWFRGLPNNILDQLAAMAKSQGDAVITGTSGISSSPLAVSGSVQQWILSAIAATGVPTTWAGPLATLVARESGGNPNAINRTDANALAGHPSQGLAQVIPGTFAAYHQAGTSSNILDPVANLAAAINYIKARYGTIFAVQQANAALPPHGYDNGGNLPLGLSAVWNGTGKPEPVLGPGSQEDIAAIRDYMGQLVYLFAHLAGQPRLGGQQAMQRYG